MVRRIGFAALLAAAGWFGLATPQVAAQSPFTIELTANSGRSWVGISLDELSDVTKSQLGIATGVVILDVVPDSPAAKAGIQKHDILTKIGDQEVKAPEAIPEIIGKAGGELAFTLLRGGKQQIIKVTPTPRPEGGTLELAGNVEAKEQSQLAKRLLDKALKIYSAEKDGQPIELNAVGPAIVLRADAIRVATHAKLPDDVKIVITREGSKPATIKVTRGDKSWDITEEKIGELPKDLREVVRLNLTGGPGFDRLNDGPGGGIFTLRLPEGIPSATPRFGPEVPVPPQASDDAMQRIEKQLKEMRKQLDDLKSRLKDAAN